MSSWSRSVSLNFGDDLQRICKSHNRLIIYSQDVNFYNLRDLFSFPEKHRHLFVSDTKTRRLLPRTCWMLLQKWYYFL